MTVSTDPLFLFNNCLYLGKADQSKESGAVSNT